MILKYIKINSYKVGVEKEINLFIIDGLIEFTAFKFLKYKIFSI